MFVDSSALVSMILPEEDGERLADILEGADQPFTSPAVIFESVLAIVRHRHMPTADASMVVLDFLQRAGVRLVDIHADAHLIALEAHKLYGKRTGNPARLNMGDCFSYALAKQAGVPLLYKGEDFKHTDLA